MINEYVLRVVDLTDDQVELAIKDFYEKCGMQKNYFVVAIPQKSGD